ncbi:MAG: TraX family protein [Oscillospiraceae bacterium]
MTRLGSRRCLYAPDPQTGPERQRAQGSAILAMTLDHLTWTLWPGYAADWWVLVCHLLGRVTAPIMWFFIVEGYHYTHDVKKYAARLFALAAVSHFAYRLLRHPVCAAVHRAV